jgi:hypothetical protein
MKFLPHDLRQVNYKILRLDSKILKKSIFLDECSRGGSFELQYKRLPLQEVALPAVTPTRSCPPCGRLSSLDPHALFSFATRMPHGI